MTVSPMARDAAGHEDVDGFDAHARCRCDNSRSRNHECRRQRGHDS